MLNYGKHWNEIADKVILLIRGNKKHLFELGNEEQLLSELEDLGVADYCNSKPIFPLAELANISLDQKFNTEEKSALQTLILLLENSHIRARQEIDAQEEPSEETSEDEDDGNAEENKLKLLITHILNRYTFKNEAINFYRKYLSRNKKLKKAHKITQKTTETASEQWEKTKENLRAFFALIGLDGLFVVIEVLMKRSKTFELIMKTIGSLALPLLIAIYLLYVLAKWISNPFEKLARWFADQVNFKLPEGGEE